MIDSLLLIKVLIDFGLVVLILMVQLTIYPSFRYFKREDLIKWHHRYTAAIGIIVGPLMVIQLFLSIYFIFGKQQYFFGIVHLVLILLIWLSTATQFVPIHNRITNDTHTDKDLKNLVKRNWIRVILWILIFTTSMLHYWILTLMNDLLLD